MKRRSPLTKNAPFAFGLGLAVAFIANQGDVLAAAESTAVTIDDQGCRFSPQINRILSSLPQRSDHMQTHTARRATRFAFESLHGVGVVENWDAEWSEVRLYFREDLPALKKALVRIGLGVDGRGHVAVPMTLADELGLNIEAVANDGRYFAGARSYLACGSV